MEMNNTWTPKRAMFIFAHPDDIEFTVAGTATKWARDGCQIVYIVLTDGNAGSHEAGMTPERLAEIRQAEQTAAARVAGVETVEFAGCPDCFLEPTLILRKKLVRLIRRYRPNVVVCGDPRAYFSGDTYINHPDHRAAATVAIEAVFPAAEMELLYPDLLEEGLKGHKPNYVLISTGRDPNFYVDVSETLDLKIEALRQHASQLGDWDPSPMIREWSVETGKQVGLSHAESFRRITLKEMETEE